ncbi:MAG: recombinase family protein [Leptospirales bacterium]
MKVGIYARVSTKDKGQTPENQLTRLRQFCKERSWGYEEYQDKAKGKDPNRPDLKRIMDDLPFLDGILVLRVDRFGRSVIDLKNRIEKIRSQGKFFMAVDQGINLGGKRDPMSEMLFNFLCAIAEFESDLISERIRDGIARAKGTDSAKKVNGRPTAFQKRGVPESRALELQSRGKSIREISQLLNIKRSSIARALKASQK